MKIYENLRKSKENQWKHKFRQNWCRWYHSTRNDLTKKMRLIAYPEAYDTPSKIQLFHRRPHCSKFNISIPLTSMLELPRRESRSEINWVPPLFLWLVSRFGGLGHYICSKSAISSRCIAEMLLRAASGAQGLYSGTSQCGSHRTNWTGQNRTEHQRTEQNRTE